MAERKLNINAPLMSVRRSSATPPSFTEAKKKILEKRHTLQYYKSDMNSDQVTEPVAVPFNWEHIPGRRKGNGGSEPQPPKSTSITPSPRLPPGKSINPTKQSLEKESKAAYTFRPSNKSKSFNVSVVKIDFDKERKAEKIVESRRSNVKYYDDSDDDDSNDAFSDALENLSPTESFSMNCSVSGVSGLENLDAKKFGTFSTDQQTRDFMMSRFLPAAKAMTLQPPQYSSKKQSVLVEQQPRDISKLVREEKLLPNKHNTDIIPYTGQCQDEESEDEGDDNEYDNSGNITAKGCGLLPQLHIRNSLCLMNPVAAMKMKNQVPLPSASEVVKPNKSSHIRSFSPVPAVKKVKTMELLCTFQSFYRSTFSIDLVFNIITYLLTTMNFSCRLGMQFTRANQALGLHHLTSKMVKKNLVVNQTDLLTLVSCCQVDSLPFAVQELLLLVYLLVELNLNHPFAVLSCPVILKRLRIISLAR